MQVTKTPHIHATELMLKGHDDEHPWVRRPQAAPSWSKGEIIQVEGRLCRVTNLHTETHEMDGLRHTWTRVWLEEVHPSVW